jgi:nucleoporin SEH1
VVETLVGHKGPVHDIAWAPNLGRSYHLIATASKDHTVRIWQIDIKEKSLENVKESAKPTPTSSYHATEVACFNDHKSEVWRVEWNLTGTVLASSGDDGSVMLWKANFLNQWKLLTIINTSS